MNENKFSEALGELSDKYITEAINYNVKKKNRTISHLIKKSVVAASIVLLLGFGILMAVGTETRAALWGYAKELYDEIWYKFYFEGEFEPTTDTKYELGWIPNGIEYVTKYEIIGGESYIYKDEKDLLIVFSYSSDPDYVFYMDGADNIKQKVKVNGCPGETFITPSEDETNTIVWTDESVPIIFSFTAECDVDTLIKVAENVKIIE